jgi:hypothetical protein
VVSLEDANPYGFVHPDVITRVQANATLQHLYHTEEGFNVGSKSVVVNGHVILETDGVFFYTMAGDTFNLGAFWAELTPLGPTTIPSGGGNLNYNIAGGNTGLIGWAVDVWADVTLPSGTTTGPVLGPVNNFNLPAGFSTDRDRTLTVAGSSPAGNYMLNSYLGEYDPPSSVIYAMDQLPFTKSGIVNSVCDEAHWFVDSGELFESVSSPVMPAEISLIGNYPNPFNAVTVISYQLSANSFVRLRVYDTAGRLVEVLVDGWRPAGTHELTFAASHLPSGMYFAKLETGEYRGVQTMVLLK